MQRSPDLYEAPLEFLPERFESVNRNPFTWLPFSAGARNCIGKLKRLQSMALPVEKGFGVVLECGTIIFVLDIFIPITVLTYLNPDD